MPKKIMIDLPKDFAVLCTLWNVTPEAIIQFYTDHVSLSAMVNRLGFQPHQNAFLSALNVNKVLDQLDMDAFGLATFFTVFFVPRPLAPTYTREEIKSAGM